MNVNGNGKVTDVVANTKLICYKERNMGHCTVALLPKIALVSIV